MAINIQPTLLGKCLKIRPITLMDFESLYKAASDPLIWELHPEPLRYTRPVFTKLFDGAIECKGGMIIEDASSKQVIGTSRYYFNRPTHKDIAIGYTFLTRQYWGRTYNHELKHLMMTHIYQYVDRIYFFVGEQNMRSRGAMRRIGGKLLADQDYVNFQLAKQAGSVCFYINKDDFKGLL